MYHSRLGVLIGFHGCDVSTNKKATQLNLNGFFEKTRTAFYALRRLSTGLASAAFIDWKLMLIKAINRAVKPATANTHQLKGVTGGRIKNGHCTYVFVAAACLVYFQKKFEKVMPIKMPPCCIAALRRA